MTTTISLPTRRRTTRRTTEPVAAARPTIHLVDLSGDVTAASEARLAEAVAGAPEGSALLLDCTRLQHLDSGGIGQLVVLLVRAQRRGQRVAAFGLKEHHRRIFTVTRLDEVIDVVDDAWAAATAV